MNFLNLGEKENVSNFSGTKWSEAVSTGRLQAGAS